MEFNASKVREQIVEWIRNWFEENGKGCNAVLGISGGRTARWWPRCALRRWAGIVWWAC